MSAIPHTARPGDDPGDLGRPASSATPAATSAAATATNAVVPISLAAVVTARTAPPGGHAVIASAPTANTEQPAATHAPAPNPARSQSGRTALVIQAR